MCLAILEISHNGFLGYPRRRRSLNSSNTVVLSVMCYIVHKIDCNDVLIRIKKINLNNN